jgi:hypothetical protein
MRITSTGQMRLAGAGITFNGDTATANELDDYEEGTWTPGWAPASGTIAADIASGRYIKIGRSVYVWGYVSYGSNSGASGIVEVTGLPFTSATGSNGFGQSNNRAGGVYSIGNAFWTSNAPNLGNIPVNGTRITPFISAATGSTALTFADFGLGGNFSQFVFAGMYLVD